jgi:hypothetical protein
VQREAIYDVWAPAGGVWSQWARPVLFAQMLENAGPGRTGITSVTTRPVLFSTTPENAPASTGDQPWRRLDVSWVPAAAEPVAVVVRPRRATNAAHSPVGERTALVVDMDGAESVHMGLALAARGYRPVPLFNACTGLHEVIDQRPIIDALRAGTEYLAAQSLPLGAPPAFLLDARRMSPFRRVGPGDFDNRWQVFPQDFPSVLFMIERRFTLAVLVQRGRKEPQDDVNDVLLGWQNFGVRVQVKDLFDAAAPTPVTLAQPAWYRWFPRRILETIGLRGAPRGGFGRIVPEPSHG